MRGETSYKEERWVKFAVSLYPPFHDNDRALSKEFNKLFDALAYANGEDGSDFAHATRPAQREEYPLYKGPTVWPTGPIVWRDDL